MGVSLSRETDVVAEAAPARDQARVFLTLERLAEALSGGAGPRIEEGHDRVAILPLARAAARR
jgi:hypothetical protein